MNRTTTTTNGHVETAAEAVLQAGTDLQAAAVDSARQVSDAAVKEATRMSDLVSDWLQRQSQTAQGAASAVRERATAASESTQRYVRDEPVKAVLIAAAAGAVITGLVMLATRASSRALRKRALESGSIPPSLAATVISRMFLVEALDFAASDAAFLCLTFDHLL